MTVSLSGVGGLSSVDWSGLQGMGGQEPVSWCRLQCHSECLHRCVTVLGVVRAESECVVSSLGGGSGLRLPNC